MDRINASAREFDVEKNSGSLLYPLANRIVDIRYLSSSQECAFIEYLALLDEENPQRNHQLITETNIIRKLFIQHTGQGNSIDYNQPLFLKNKYLYLLGEGSLYYLQARNSMQREKNKLDDLEIKALIKILSSDFKDKDNVTVVSLGSANAEKEISALTRFTADYNYQGTIDFIPVDVSVPLIQLAVLRFNQAFIKHKNIKITPLVADFWDIAKEGGSVFSPSDTPKVFTLLGSTIGNYKEEELLKQIISFMDYNDFLLVGFDLLPDPHNDIETSRTLIYDQYNTIGNMQFMLNPLSHIPKYRGYASSFDKYFKIDKMNAVISASNRQEYDFLTDIEGSLIYAPRLEIPSGTDKMRISMAQSTKYRLDCFQKWIEDFAFKQGTGNEEITMLFKIINQREAERKCVMLLRKELRSASPNTPQVSRRSMQVA